MSQRWRALLLLLCCLSPLVMTVACKNEQNAPSSEDPTGAKPTSQELPPLEVKDDTPKLLLTWIDEKGDFHVVQKVAEVPEAERRIAVYATQEVWTYAAIVAILASGRAYVPLNPPAPVDRNRSCIDQAGIATLLCARTAPAIATWRADLGDALRVVETSGIAPRSPLAPIGDVDESAMAYLLFTLSLIHISEPTRPY